MSMDRIAWMDRVNGRWYIRNHMGAFPIEDVQGELGLAWCRDSRGYWLEDIGTASNFYYQFEPVAVGAPINQCAYEQVLLPTPQGWALCEKYGPDGMPYADFLNGLPTRRYDVLFRHIAPVSDMLLQLGIA